MSNGNCFNRVLPLWFRSRKKNQMKNKASTVMKIFNPLNLYFRSVEKRKIKSNRKQNSDMDEKFLIDLLMYVLDPQTK